ncbi:MAG: hypothetical protein QOI77_2006 [Blastocatellia bacterium]|jgi:hypothetical protein|nr:hypothetical protein [Blastocatellia bacterium]
MCRDARYAIRRQRAQLRQMAAQTFPDKCGKARIRFLLNHPIAPFSSVITSQEAGMRVADECFA